MALLDEQGFPHEGQVDFIDNRLNPQTGAVRMRAYGIPHMKVMDAVQRANQETGGSVLELGEAEYMVRASGYLQSLDDFRKIPLMTTDAGVSVRF